MSNSVVAGNLAWLRELRKKVDTDNGEFRIGQFSSTAVGKGIAISSTRTKALDVCADDGGKALTSSTQAARFRTLIATAIASGDVSVQGALGHLKVAANVAATGYLAGLRGYLEASSASLSTGAGLRGMADVPSGSTIAANHVVAALQLDSNDLGGTHTGKAAAIHAPNPVAGTWDYLLVLGTATGCHTAGAGTYSTADGYLLIRVGASDMRIPYFAGTD